jgi:hypothetical protein
VAEFDRILNLCLLPVSEKRFAVVQKEASDAAYQKLSVLALNAGEQERN